MGALLSFFWGGWSPKAMPALPEIPDPVTGLTQREKDFVISSWNDVKKNIGDNGVQLFLRFFDKLPSSQKRFSSFATMPRAELATSKRFKAHTNSVMYSIDSIVSNLDDVEVVQEMLLKVGHNHARRNIPKSEFEVLMEALMDLMKDKLKIHKNPIGEPAWNKVFEVMYDGMFKGIDEILNK